MSKEEMENLIGGMPLDDGEKAALVSDLNSGMPAQKIIEKIELLLAAKEKALDDADPEAAAAHVAIKREYQEEIQKAAAEFDGKMKQIWQEADAVAKDVSRQLDGVRADEIKEGIQG